MSKSGKSTTLATTFFLFSLFFLNPVANMAANYVSIKYKKLVCNNKAVLEPRVSPAFAITYFCNHCNIRFENTSKYVDTLTFFPKTWTKGHWPLDDLWPHVSWGHMCDSTQGSLCPSPMTVHQCMWIQWSTLQNTTYIHTHTYYVHTTYILHTTYRMSDHIVSYWTQFRRDKNKWPMRMRLGTLVEDLKTYKRTLAFS